MRKYKKVIFITGCSSGLGSSLVQRCLDLDYIVYATVRDTDNQGELALISNRSGLRVLALDVSDANAVASVVAEIQQEALNIDALIVNAGKHVAEPIECVTSVQIEQLFGCNFIGALNCVQAVLPIMRKQKCGNIIAISSLSAQIGLPCDGLYSASKAALERVFESLRSEVAPFGINVSVVVPSTFPSRLLQGAVEDPINKKSPYYPLLTHSRAKLAEKSTGSIDSVVEATISVIDKPESPFRVPVDSVSTSILSKIYCMKESVRETSVMEWSDSAWWLQREREG